MRKNGASEKLEQESSVGHSRSALPIPFLAGRPKREVSIGQDDLTNLIIALYTCSTMEEFFEQT